MASMLVALILFMNISQALTDPFISCASISAIPQNFSTPRVIAPRARSRFARALAISNIR